MVLIHHILYQAFIGLHMDINSFISDVHSFDKNNFEYETIFLNIDSSTLYCITE